jgi:AcrR family transcriptional regulator
MIELSARTGYHRVSIAELCASAGVSPVTFYEHFADKEGVLVAAYQGCIKDVFGRLAPALAESEINDAPRVALRSLLDAVASDPGAGRILFIEALVGGERMRDERKRAFATFERRASDFTQRTAGDERQLDVPAIAVIGALRHVVARHLRAHAEDQLPARLEDALTWLYAYARPSGAEPWSTSERALLEGAPEAPPPLGELEPERLPPGRHGLPAGLVARHQRTRLIYAIAEATMRKGYASTTIEDIVAQARVAKPVFYRYFTDKLNAFLEAQHHPTQHILERCAQAYYGERQWPARMWRLLETLIGLVSASPAISHLRFVECHAAGPEPIRRAEEITRSFTIFLEEGYYQSAESRALPRLCSQASAGAIFEIIRRHIAQGRVRALTAQLPILTYIAIAPFTGAERAIGLVEEIRAGRRA